MTNKESNRVSLFIQLEGAQSDRLLWQRQCQVLRVRKSCLALR